MGIDYGRPDTPSSTDASEPKPPRRGSGWWRHHTRRAAIILLWTVGFSGVALGVVYAMTPVPDAAQSAATAQGSTFYFSDGKTRLARLGVNRQAVELSQVPEPVRQAVLSAEDRNFYSEPGVSVKGTVRALWSTLSGKQIQGGSTITQQLVRNYYEGFSQERTVTRKLKEIMVSLKVGREQSKDWILTQYLNTIYLGRDAYGIQAAAKAYYNEDVDTLTTAQAAYLAAAIQQPIFFAEPDETSRPAAEERWRYVVNGMVQRGAISQAEAAQMKFPEPDKHKPTQTYNGSNGYLINEAKRELARRGYSEDAVNRSGFKIVTTYDAKLTKAAKDAVEYTRPDGTAKQVQMGLVSVDPATGEVPAFYGGKDFLKDQYDNVFDSRAQAGSGFKPYVLAAALDKGMSLRTTVDGSSPQDFDGKPVRNDGGRSYGHINLVTATQNSVNTAYVNLGLKVGLDKVVETAEKAGIPRAQLSANGVDKAPTLSLGAASVSPAQQGGGFATFAAEGKYRRPHVIRSITDSRGQTRKFPEEGTEAFKAQSAKDATYAMTKVVESGTGTGANLPDGRPVAGKTGTTDKGRAIWFNGFVPQMATSVGVFRDDNKPLKIPGYSVYGGQLPAQIWRDFMTKAMDGEPIKDFGSPSDEPAPSTPKPSPTETTEKPTEEPSPSPSPSEPTIEPPTEPPTDPPTKPPTSPPPPPDDGRLNGSALAGRPARTGDPEGFVRTAQSS